MRNKLLIFLIILLSVNLAFAGFDKLIRDVFPSGTMSNQTRAAVVHEQAAGHFMGGSVIIKTPAQPGLQLVQARAPSCKMGGLPCGAQFELLGGGVSLVSSQELMKYLKTLPANAATYAGMMAIKSLCPQCQDLMEWLDAKADWINEMSNLECKDMQKLMDGVLPSAWAKDRALRQSSMILDGRGKDIAYYQSHSEYDGRDPKGGNPELESQLGDNFNLVWKALEKKVRSSSDGKSLKELLMSISGTIIGKCDAQGKRSVKHLKSLINKDLIKQFIGADASGSRSMRLYVCDDNNLCLNPKLANVSVKQNAFLYRRITELLSSIVEKVYQNRGELAADEEMLVALSSEQLILKIEMDLATYSDRRNVVDNQSEFIEALCFDVVVGYLQSLLVEVQEVVGELEHGQMGDRKKFKAFEQDTRETMRILSQARAEARGRYDLIMQSKNRLRQETDYFDRSFESFISNHANK